MPLLLFTVLKSLNSRRLRQNSSTILHTHWDKKMAKSSGVMWGTVFDMSSMAQGMSPDFLHKLLNERQVFARHGKLLTAILWLQSQMIGLIHLHEDSDLRERCRKDNGRHLPHELGPTIHFTL